MRLTPGVFIILALKIYNNNERINRKIIGINVNRCSNVRPDGVAPGPNRVSSTAASPEPYRTPASMTTGVRLRSFTRRSRLTSTRGKPLRDTKSSYRPSPTEARSSKRFEKEKDKMKLKKNVSNKFYN
jgi:hypothetical protein